jgi:hypothetical protein
MVGTYDGGGVAGGGGAGGGGALPRPVFCRLAGPSRSGGAFCFLTRKNEAVRGEGAGELRCRTKRSGRARNCGRAPARRPNTSRYWRDISVGQ